MNFGVPVMVSNQCSNSDTHLITVYRVIWKPCQTPVYNQVVLD